jgi:hypothetical protein
LTERMTAMMPNGMLKQTRTTTASPM